MSAFTFSVEENTDGLWITWLFLDNIIHT